MLVGCERGLVQLLPEYITSEILDDPREVCKYARLYSFIISRQNPYDFLSVPVLRFGEGEDNARIRTQRLFSKAQNRTVRKVVKDISGIWFTFYYFVCSSSIFLFDDLLFSIVRS